ncbi:hypothetical protein DFH09DRAFT_1092103 [Mycena vulgaris]|nr:hypothetical protein DFH09DRAFT_1092103 [Mycena vulgaris]
MFRTQSGFWESNPGPDVLGPGENVRFIWQESIQPVENEAFWDTIGDIWLKEDLSVPDSVLDDINVVEESIDHRLDEDGATEALSRFKRLLELKDGWRATNPDLKAYTSPHGVRLPDRLYSRLSICAQIMTSSYSSDIRNTCAGSLKSNRIGMEHRCDHG